MIHEVDEGLRRLLVEGGVQESGVELVFDAPTREWSAKRNAPAVSVFLYDIREDVARRRTGSAEEHDGDGVVVGWRGPPRWFQLTYLVTAWTNRPQDEHRLLSDVLRCLVRTDVLAPRLLTGSLAELGLAVGLDVSGPGSGGPSASDVWSALGGELRPAVDVRVTAPLRGEHTPAGPPVTDGLVVRSAPSATPGAEPEDVRRLRYEGAETRDGFAAARARREPASRRRRRGSTTR
ncbi:DUF4255 domain-containing protein [Umezawaea beigongshangensis]|uniref:DUF4255 domain-containing protein n=1 Tax=Umezawaea beigongshangensis TaxID=2780383 RepID=UPI0018F23DB6|nr:DUF4255 domain-containing protein [Umezawaea beigongshangensis]